MRAWSMLLVTLCACATGAPTGGRLAFQQVAYRPFAPDALPRFIPVASAPAEPLLLLPGSRQRAVELARSLLDKPRIELGGKRYPDDCTGLVRAILDGVGIESAPIGAPGENGVTAIFRFAQAHGRVFEGGRPLPGDLVFFKETYDLNSDGRPNDGLTHVGLVEDVTADGTVLVIHRVRRGVVRYRMNLEHPRARTDPASGAVLNDYLRVPGPGNRRVLTGELFAAYATFLPVEGRFASR